MRFQGEARGRVGAQLELSRVGPQWFGTIFTECQWAGDGRSGGEILSLHASHYRPAEQACRSEISERRFKVTIRTCPVCPTENI